MANSDLPQADPHYYEATIRTAGELRGVATTSHMMELSQLSLPDIHRLSDEVARVVPAGNVPSLILSGLARVNDRTVQPTEAQKHIGLLVKGVEVTLKKVATGAFFFGAAGILHGYQQMLRLAGKDVDSAFPEGTWQFYLEFALREDSARHANETTGFQARIAIDKLNVTDADKLAAWIVACAITLDSLPSLLANEWRERVIARLLTTIAEEHNFRTLDEYQRLYAQWEQQRPYGRASLNEPYAQYRRRLFDTLWLPYAERFRRNQRDQFETRLRLLEASSLPAYQRQMSWLAYLQPEPYLETRVPYLPQEAHIGVIWQGRYYLIPLASALTLDPARRIAATILSLRPKQAPANLDEALVNVARSGQASLRNQLPNDVKLDLERLRRTPILINWDLHDATQPLALIRQTRRGIGDHPLTLIRTTDSMVFDQSHIFFDGAWGAAVAQIITNEALAWVYHFSQTPLVKTTMAALQFHSPPLQISPNLAATAQNSRITPEACAEGQFPLKPVQSLRAKLKQRNDLARVTVNDLFILYRGFHAQLYEPSPSLRDALNTLAKDRRTSAKAAYQATLTSLDKLKGKNPAILIPIDASRHDPKDRVFPMTFWNPLPDFVRLHQDVLALLTAAVRADQANPKKAFGEFEQRRAEYLRSLGGFGELLAKYREIALRGESSSTQSIKMLAHLPPAIQQLFTSIPSKFDVMNEVIKGEEVFSNIGRVSKGSSLRRFITAKDDNELKTLCWGVLTDDRDMVHLSLRDFRPHVKLLHECGMAKLAQQVIQEYLDAYINGFMHYLDELNRITVARFGATGILG